MTPMLLSFGQIGFFIVGAYAAGELTVPADAKHSVLPQVFSVIRDHSVGNAASLVIATAVAAVFAAVLVLFAAVFAAVLVVLADVLVVFAAAFERPLAWLVCRLAVFVVWLVAMMLAQPLSWVLDLDLLIFKVVRD